MGDPNSGISFVLDTSNYQPKVKPEDQLEEFLIEYTLHVDDRGYKLHGLIWAKDSQDAYVKMPNIKRGENHYVSKEHVIGAVKDEERRAIHDRLHNLGGGIILP